MPALQDAWSNQNLTVTVDEYLGLLSCENEARIAYGITKATTQEPTQTTRDVVYCTPSEVRQLLANDLPEEAKTTLEKGFGDFKTMAETCSTCMPTALESRKEQTKTNIRGFLGQPNAQICVEAKLN